MDIFIRNVPPQSTDKELTKFFKYPLEQISVHVYAVQKMKGKPFAKLTLPRKDAAELFLQRYGSAQPISTINFQKQPQGTSPRVGPFPFNNTIPRQQQPNYQTGGQAKTLLFQRQMMNISRSNTTPDRFLLQSLEAQEKALLNRKSKGLTTGTVAHPTTHAYSPFAVRSLACGIWEYRTGSLGFTPLYEDNRTGRVIFGRNSLVIILHSASAIKPVRLDVAYHSIDCIITGGYQNPSVTLSLTNAPKFYEEHAAVDGSLDALSAQLATIALGSPSNSTSPNARFGIPKSTKVRVPSFGVDHEGIASTCFVYRLALVSWADVQSIHHMFRSNPGFPSNIPLDVTVLPRRAFRQELDSLISALANYNVLGQMPFGVRFQLQKLAVNGILSPHVVIGLVPAVTGILKRHGSLPSEEALRQLGDTMSLPGPHVDPSHFDPEELAHYVEDLAGKFRYSGSMYELRDRHRHIVLAYRAMVTPAGTYLEGPTQEVINRVLRKYPQHVDYFIRVTFADEDGEMVRYDPIASMSQIFHGRFQGILDRGISIAGRTYMFLGFSHSSLRSQSCWFMAPFVQGKGLIHAKDVIKNLGNFSDIRSPAKCAARIGQAFSDTTAAIPLTMESIGVLPDIKRNGRVFSDGVGTISKALLHRVWQEWSFGNKRKPTCLQIRFAGAKGMVSLDERLQGEKLNLRESMLKFNAPSQDLELCGANFKPLPLYLNRQFIKILEDLGIPANVFLDLQTVMIEKLRRVTLSPINAAYFLETNFVGKGAGIPSLIRLLDDIGLPFQQDDFLRDTVEIAVLVQLRDLKHRARIFIEGGYTLLGIVDETNTLKEGEIYCVVETHSGSRHELVRDRVAITRAPAMHPGDIQVVRAVTVPKDSPLKALTNCVVFSQQGARDLPSELSGGDLDGDLYNVIYDPALIPRMSYEPADYPRVPPLDIGREVLSEDITRFFVQFMETDQLGRISNLHVQKADMVDDGVNLNDIPKAGRVRPDFMAPGPRVIIEDKGDIDIKFEDPEDGLEEEDPVSALDPYRFRYRFYESDKVLGKLYRAIDEGRFFDELHRQGKQFAESLASTMSFMQRLWKYVEKDMMLIQWEHNKDLAREIRNSYETNLLDVMASYSPHHKYPLTELEVFSGSILGKSAGANNKRVREQATAMKERFERDVEFTVERITQGEEEHGAEALDLAIACFAIGVQEPGARVQKGRPETLKSWTYVAAGVCLGEMEKFRFKATGLKYGRVPLKKIEASEWAF
ncbi:RdRP-domain-containing protein [Patellaria atrata CBS 101060]|uniref:RNA-dependent RNA polymerase n=1 Tax=Patellaria atrata CBS 101060 TaxID=1346257 RepID=A0A9P4S9P3_9PEZI|nr:RdRP-domain-containing protein [Patellaria atrata CBS 101060]